MASFKFSFLHINFIFFEINTKDCEKSRLIDGKPGLC
jgi:hypothetical protein